MHEHTKDSASRVVSARTLGMWVDPSGTGRCVPRAVPLDPADIV